MATSSFQRMFKTFFGLAVLGSCLSAGPAAAVSAGDYAPLFSAPSLRGASTLNIKDYRGKVLYMEFWASWCPPCWDVFPVLEQIKKEFQEEGLEEFEVIGVNINDELPDAAKAVSHLGASFPLVRPQDDTVMHAYGIKAMPYGVLIDRKGVVRSVYLGLSRSERRELKNRIRRLLWTGL